jgi:hypothetical protein
MLLVAAVQASAETHRCSLSGLAGDFSKQQR